MNKINYIIKLSILIITGIIAIIIPNPYIQTFHTTIYILTIICTIIAIITSINRKNFSYFNIVFLIINIILLFLNINIPNTYLKLLPTLIGIYILLIGISKLLSILIYKKIPKSKLYILINSLIHITFSIIILVNPTHNLKSFTFISGIYLIILSISYIPTKNNTKNVRIIEVPIIFQSLKPYLDFIKLDLTNFHNNDNNIEVDLEVLIHIRKNRRGVFGHADIIYNNKVYSYGNYDVNTYILGDAFGEGVLIEADKDSYITYCKSYGKRLFSFGIKLNDNEKKQFQKHFQEIMHNTYTFSKEKIKKGSYIDKLNQNTNVIFYKFKNGHYQKYSFLNYNCVKFIEELIAQNLFDFSSISTPGTLYTHLDELYRKKNSKVIRKILY